MPPRNHNTWLKQPKVESISSEIYNSHAIYVEEQQKIFSEVWVPMCHISEFLSLAILELHLLLVLVL